MFSSRIHGALAVKMGSTWTGVNWDLTSGTGGFSRPGCFASATRRGLVAEKSWARTPEGKTANANIEISWTKRMSFIVASPFRVSTTWCLVCASQPRFQLSARSLSGFGGNLSILTKRSHTHNAAELNAPQTPVRMFEPVALADNPSEPIAQFESSRIESIY